MVKDNDSHMCPVCGKYEFETYGSNDICEVCGWEDDWLQEERPDYAGGANIMSLNQMRKAYKMGMSRKEAKEAFRKGEL